MAYIPERGDAVWITLNPQAGHEQAGRRPAVVLSPSAYNKKVGRAILCPITNQAKGYPFEVAIPNGLESVFKRSPAASPRRGTSARTRTLSEFEDAFLEVTGVILSDQVKSLDWKARRAERIDRLPDEIILEVLLKLNTLLAR